MTELLLGSAALKDGRDSFGIHHEQIPAFSTLLLQIKRIDLLVVDVQRLQRAALWLGVLQPGVADALRKCNTTMEVPIKAMSSVFGLCNSV